MPFRNWKEAKELGVSLPEAACLLYTWHAMPLDDGVEPLFGYPEHHLLPSCDDVILVTANVPNEHAIEGALNSGRPSRGTYIKRKHSLLAIPGTTACPKLSIALSFSIASPMRNGRKNLKKIVHNGLR